MINFTIEPNKRAVEAMAGKVPTLPDVFKKMDADIRGRAFTVAKIHDFDVLQSCRDIITEVVSGGIPWKDARKAIAEQIEYEYADADAALAKADLVLQTNGFQAFATARFDMQRAHRASLPFLKYQTVGDAHVRESHQALDGKVIPADDPFWDDHYPPWDWGCRCVAVGISQREAERMMAADAEKPAVERRVLDDAQLKALNDGTARVMTPGGVINVDMRTPVERAQSEDARQTAYRFRPGNMAIDTAAVAKRYDPDIGDLFKEAVK